MNGNSTMMTMMMIRRQQHQQLIQLVLCSTAKQSSTSLTRRYHSFSFTGPKKLSDIMQVEKLTDKSKGEIQILWQQYHATKENSSCFSFSTDEGRQIVNRASKCKFFIQPVFRDNGHYMLVSEFQKPHFLLTYLEEYQTNRSGATPIVTASLFDDFHGKDLTLVRCDYDARLTGDDAPRALQCILNNYLLDYTTIETFNHKAGLFDIDSFVTKSKERWHGDV